MITCGRVCKFCIFSPSINFVTLYFFYWFLLPNQIFKWPYCYTVWTFRSHWATSWAVPFWAVSWALPNFSRHNQTSQPDAYFQPTIYTTQFPYFLLCAYQSIRGQVFIFEPGLDFKMLRLVLTREGFTSSFGFPFGLMSVNMF